MNSRVIISNEEKTEMNAKRFSRKTLFRSSILKSLRNNKLWQGLRYSLLLQSLDKPQKTGGGFCPEPFGPTKNKAKQNVILSGCAQNDILFCLLLQ